MVNSLQNRANVAVACNTTMESLLITTNQQQAKTIADLTVAITALGTRQNMHVKLLTAPTPQQSQPQPQQQSQGGWTQVGPTPPYD